MTAARMTAAQLADSPWFAAQTAATRLVRIDSGRQGQSTGGGHSTAGGLRSTVSPPLNRHSGSSTQYMPVGCQRVNFMLSCSGETRRGTPVPGPQAVEGTAAHVRRRRQQHATDRVGGRVRSRLGYRPAVDRHRAPRGGDVPPQPRPSRVRQGPGPSRPTKGSRPTGSRVRSARVRRTLRMSIRDNYVSTFEAIRKEYGARYSAPKIGADTSLKKAIGYKKNAFSGMGSVMSAGLGME